MKILIPTLEYPPQVGGIASYIHNQIKHWPNKSDSFVVWAPENKDEVSFDRQNSWKTYRNTPYFKFIWPRWMKLCGQVWKIVKTENIEQIHVHHVLPVGYIAYFNKKLRKIPYHVFFHGSDLALALGNKSKSKKTNVVCKNADKIIVNSNFMKEKLVDYLPEVKNKIVVAYPCSSFESKDIDKNKLAKIKNIVNPDSDTIILTVARLVLAKGIDISILAFKKVLKLYPKTKYIIIGSGEAKENLQKLIIDNNLHESIKIISASREDIPYYYSLANIFVLTPYTISDRGSEGFGIVYLEAGAFGLPIVASKTGGVPEAVIDGQTGLLVQPKNIGATVEAINKLLGDKDLMNKLGVQGCERVKNNFIWEKQLNNLQK